MIAAAVVGMYPSQHRWERWSDLSIKLKAGYDSAMTMLLPTVAAFAAVCVWLTVRIVNRRERWAKWTLAVLFCPPVLYIASFGPACWFTSRMNYGATSLPVYYRPIILTFKQIPYRYRYHVIDGIRWYAHSLATEGWEFGMLDVDEWTWTKPAPFDGHFDSVIH